MKQLFGLNRDATSVWRSSLFTVRLAALVLASAAFSGVLYVTEPAGPGMEVSSSSYLGAAESLVAGHGFRIPTAAWNSPDSESTLTHYPPGFSAAIAVPVAAGFPAVQAARLVEALSAFVAMAALLALVGDAAGASAAVLFGLALLITPALVDVHMSVLSEPLFLACVALTLASMVAMPDQPIAAGTCAAAALLVRYSGIGAVAAVVLWTSARRTDGRTRTARVALAVAPTVVLAVIGLVFAPGAAAPLIHRIAFHAGLGATIASGARTLAAWLVPTVSRPEWAAWVAVPAAIAALTLVAIGARRVYRLWRLLPADLPLHSSTNVPQLLAARVLAATALLIVCYTVTLLAARVLAVEFLAFDARLMSPLFVLFSLAFAVAVGNWWRSAPRAARWTVAVALLVWGSASVAVTRARARDGLEFGTDLGHEAWRRSGLLEWVRADGNRHALYSNWPVLAYLYLGRPARGLPETSDAATMHAFADTLAARGGVVLAFAARNGGYVPAESLIQSAGLRVLATYPDGRVLGTAAKTP